MEIFDSSNVLIGNNPMAENVQQLLSGVQQLKIYDIMTSLQFKTKLADLFINWEPVATFVTELGLESQNVESLGDATLNIPGVI